MNNIGIFTNLELRDFFNFLSPYIIKRYLTLRDGATSQLYFSTQYMHHKNAYRKRNTYDDDEFGIHFGQNKMLVQPLAVNTHDVKFQPLGTISDDNSRIHKNCLLLSNDFS